MRAMQFVDGTRSAPFSKREMDQFYRMMQVDVPEFRFDDQYVEFIEANGGGEPISKYFLVNGSWHSIERLLNFADTGFSRKEDLIFNVQQNWNLIEDRLNVGMFPFASLAGGDYLILDHTSGGMATVQFWYHERSTEDNPYLMPVASNFASFIESLKDEPG